ncbi:class I SAM-dependent methyltransferase [Actinophytocola sediminis]
MSQTETPNWTTYVDTTAPTEHERLRMLQDVFDPLSARLLDQAGVRPGWHCLEVGAGAGSVARMLAERAGADNVTATDMSTDFLTPLADIGIRVLRHDVTVDEAPGEFDLIHTRKVLEHVVERDRALARMTSWLRPGGWLLVESASPAPDMSSVPAVGRCLRVLGEVLGASVGTDPLWARAMPVPLERAGLVDCHAEGHSVAIRGGSLMARWMAATLRLIEATALERGAVTEQDLAEAYAAYRDPDFVDYTWLMISAMGRRAPR